MPLVLLPVTFEAFFAIFFPTTIQLSYENVIASFFSHAHNYEGENIIFIFPF